MPIGPGLERMQSMLWLTIISQRQLLVNLHLDCILYFIDLLCRWTVTGMTCYGILNPVLRPEQLAKHPLQYFHNSSGLQGAILADMRLAAR